MDIRPGLDGDTAACAALLGLSVWHPPAAFFVLEHEGAILGCGGYEIRAGGAWLLHGKIRPEFERQGLGRFLLFYCLKQIGQTPGVEHVRVESEAEGFFLKQGFQREQGNVFVKRLAVCGA